MMHKQRSAARGRAWRTRAGLFLILGLGLAAPAGVQAQDDYQQLLKYEFGTCDANLTNIDNQVRLSTPDQRAALEEQLLAVLQNRAATFPAKQFTCRMLRVVGSDKSVAPLAKLLGDAQLSHAARYALEGIGGAATDAALRDALTSTTGKLRIGVIGSLGARGDRQAVRALTKLLDDRDADTASAAFKALGRIGGAEAAQAVLACKSAPAAELAHYEADFRCAESCARAGEAAAARKIYEAVLAGSAPSQVRVGAFLGLVRLAPAAEVPRVMAALKSDDPVLAQATVPALLALAPQAAVPALTAELPALPADKKVVALRALAAIPGVPPLGAPLNALLADASPAVQLAAVEAAVQLGNAQNIAALAAKLATEDDAGKAAKQTLTDLQGAGVAAEIVKAANAGDPKWRVTVLGILADRRDASVLPALYTLTGDANDRVRHAATKAIGTLGGAADVGKLVDLVLTKKDGGDRDGFASAAASIAARQPDVNTRAAGVIAGLAQADDEAKVLLLGVLSALGGQPACAAVHGCLASPTPAVKKAAVKAFAEWPDALPLADLKEVAKHDANDINRILALRGYVRLLGQSDLKGHQRLEGYKEMLALATRPEEKRAVFAGLADAPSLPVLQFLEGHLTDEGVKAEALTTYEKVAEELIKPKAREAKAALERVLASTEDKNLRKRAENALKRIK